MEHLLVAGDLIWGGGRGGGWSVEGEEFLNEKIRTTILYFLFLCLEIMK